MPRTLIPGVPRRVRGGLPHVDLGREVEDDLGPHAVHRSRIRGRRGCRPRRGGPRRRAPARFSRFPGREVVEHGDLVAALGQRIDDVRADEPAPPVTRAFIGPQPTLRSVSCPASSSRSRESTARARPPGAPPVRGARRARRRGAGAGWHRGRRGPRAAQRPLRPARRPDAEALLFAAARARARVRVIRPALDDGQDRHLRPVPRLLACLPGRSARPRGGRGRAGERVRYRRAPAQRDDPA